MDPYVIAPDVVTISIDPELAAQFTILNNRLHWRPLTTNLESCEESPYLYFRISLRLRPGSVTFAGFATGAPFMLTRDKDVQKRAFFLRHWVRSVSRQENQRAPSTSLPNMSIAAQGEILLVRVSIDRPLVPEDTFKSIPFATWMFQVVEVDAFIHGVPGVRFAFAIERTVTSEEREKVAASGVELKSKGPTTRQASTQSSPLPTSRPNRQPAQPSPPVVRPARPLQPIAHPPIPQMSPKRPDMIQRMLPRPSVMQQMLPQRPTMAYSPASMRPTALPHQSDHHVVSSNRQISSGMRQNIAQKPFSVLQQTTKASSRGNSRAAVASSIGSAQSSGESLRPVMHPYLRMWEDRDLDDPYEPIFVAEDEEFNKRARRTWLVEDTPDQANRFEYQNLFGLPTADYPPYFFSNAAGPGQEGEPDIEVIVQRRHHVKDELSEREDRTKMEDAEVVTSGDGEYTATVVAAAEYNSMLRNDRSELRKWLEEDATREDGESEEAEEEDEDGDADSSD